jgi:hypothetical protein
MNYYYLDAQNQPVGPVPLEQIRALAAAGTISKDPMVRPEGSLDWRLLSSLDAPGAPTGAAGGASTASPKLPFPPKSTLLGDLVGSALGLVSKFLNPSLLDGTLGFAKRFGHYAVLVAAALTLVYGLFIAIKLEAFGLLITGIVLVAVVAVAQFAASRFLDAGGDIIANTPSRVSSRAFFDCTALVLLILAVMVTLGGIVGAINLNSFAPLLPALVGAVIMVGFATLLLHPTSINVSVGEGSAGEEAIGIITTFLKANLKLVPIVFFLLAVLGGLTLVAGFFGDRAAQSIGGGVLMTLPIPVGMLPYGFAGSTLAIVACFVPIVVYFVFLLQYLMLDVIRAILAVPAKLDALRR